MDIYCSINPQPVLISTSLRYNTITMKTTTLTYKPNITRFVGRSERSDLRHGKHNETIRVVGNFYFTDLQIMHQPVCITVYGFCKPSFLSFIVSCLINYEGWSRQAKTKKEQKKNEKFASHALS